ncbi:MAG: hypothetical protein ACI9G1_003667 [Pirellulaceae bacterium]|jgi:hypothetical protein
MLGWGTGTSGALEIGTRSGEALEILGAGGELQL